MRVLLTGGSGFIAAHVLDTLLEHGHSVVTTVRTQEKADKIKAAHPKANKSQLDFAIVEDIAQPNAFAHAVKSDPPFEAVIHTASPFHFNAKDIQKDLLDPAIKGTHGVLQAIKANAPTVKRVVITSSFASIVDPTKGLWPEKTYTEKDWSPLDHKTALESQSNGYRASKALAEKTAWDFVANEKPNFDLVTMCPPLVLGPIVHYLNSLDSLNTSNQRVRDIMQGKCKEEIPETGTYIFINVNDLALAHVKAIETPAAGGKRFLISAGNFSNKQLVEIVRKNFPQYKDQMPGPNVKGGDFPEGGVFKADNSQTVNVLGIKFTSLDESIIQLVKSLQAVGA